MSFKYSRLKKWGTDAGLIIMKIENTIARPRYAMVGRPAEDFVASQNIADAKTEDTIPPLTITALAASPYKCIGFIGSMHVMFQRPVNEPDEMSHIEHEDDEQDCEVNCQAF